LPCGNDEIVINLEGGVLFYGRTLPMAECCCFVVGEADEAEESNAEIDAAIAPVRATAPPRRIAHTHTPIPELRY
jgi:hypothetical protein